ncbi:GNAT family N-acetyltransferase [Vibrio sp. SS-MA-C1-2]|uniref:GNAT family N-acetyltransferase n=1 Tax=Vibrio sp. SS-MA-C1-2 TaxID=2908646 RepID=UPI001F3BBEDE|nr:GNAT family N-acetyltransferase [Vibrio sp. SS-MA-C1-2]UJF19194.1 GNAT family N-acetyltransferase [Vibrio sp. SS-MA-C1-2]
MFNDKFSDYRFHLLEPLRFPLVTRLYKNHYPAGKPKKDETIWIGESNKGIVSAVRYKRVTDSIQLLTGMLVIPELRGEGVADQLLIATKSVTEEKICYCFAYRYLVPLYQRHQFVEINAEQLPPELASRFHSYCQSGKDLVPMIYQA